MFLKFIIFCFVFVMIVRIVSRVVSFTLSSSSTGGTFKQQRTQTRYQNPNQQQQQTGKMNRKDDLENIEEAEYEDITDEES